MNRRLLALLAAMSLVFAGAVGATTAGAAPQAPSPIAAYSPGTITGTVTRAGQVLAGAEVVIWTYDGRHIADLVTDAAGSYTTGVLAAGSYRVGVLPPAGGTFFSTYYGDTVRTSDVTPVKVTATGPQVADIAVKYGGSITGTVLNARGTAMAGIWVRATATNRFGIGLVQSDAQGRYTLAGLPAGTYEIDAVLHLGEDDDDGDGPALDRAIVESVKVKTGRTTAVPTFRLVAPPRGTSVITGKIVGWIGVYLGNNAITLRTKGFETRGHIGAKGKVRVEALPAGTYKVYLNGTNTYRKVKVAKGKRASFGTWKRAKGTTISGTFKSVKSKAHKRGAVIIYDAAGTLLGSTSMSAKGKYSIPGAISGKYTVVGFNDGKYDVAPRPKTIKVSKGKKRTVSLRLVAPSTIKGTIVDAAGCPVVGIYVNAIPTSSRYELPKTRSDRTNSKGQYSIKRVLAGSYKIATDDGIFGPGGYRISYYKGKTLKKSKTVKPKVGKSIRLSAITVR